MRGRADRGAEREVRAGPVPPVKVLDLELSQPLPDLAPDGAAEPYRWARALVRLHDRPLGLVDLPLGAGGLSAAAAARLIWATLREDVARHLAADGLPCPPELPAGGIGPPGAGPPSCTADRHAARAAARPISVVVGTHDRPAALGRCLRSLRELDHPAFEVIVVDNAPTTAATRDLVLGRHPEVRYLREDRPGVSAARNRGVREATGELIAMTDDDVTVDRLWLLELAAAFARDERVACVTGLVVAASLETPAELWADRHWALGKGYADAVFREPLRRLSARPYPYTAGAFGSGNNMAFRAAVLRELGGFDPVIGPGTPTHGGEDLAAFFAVIAAGHAIRYAPAAIVRHWYVRDVEALRRQAYAYGSGLTAYLAKVLADDPARALDIAARAPRALAHAGALARGRRGGGDGRPADLVRLERRGMAHGALGYLRSRRAATGAPE